MGTTIERVPRSGARGGGPRGHLSPRNLLKRVPGATSKALRLTRPSADLGDLNKLTLSQGHPFFASILSSKTQISFTVCVGCGQGQPNKKVRETGSFCLRIKQVGFRGRIIHIHGFQEDPIEEIELGIFLDPVFTHVKSTQLKSPSWSLAFWGAGGIVIYKRNFTFMFLKITKILFNKAQYKVCSHFTIETGMVEQLERAHNQNKQVTSKLFYNISHRNNIKHSKTDCFYFKYFSEFYCPQSR